MRRVKGLLLAALAVIGMSMPCHAENPCKGITQTRQLDSLRTVYYRGGELPADPSDAELATLRASKEKPDLEQQAAMLESAFPKNERLQAIAIRDRDGDGIKDYRITRCGEFRENDPDVDCDGVADVLDASPYGYVETPGLSCGSEPDWSKITNDGNGNGLPDQIDWRLLDASGSGKKRPAAVQEALYRDYKIVLVDRRKRMSAAMATDLDHVIRDIYHGQIMPGFPSLRVITTDLSVCGEGDYYGWASPETSTVFFMPETTKLSPIMRLEILVHEHRHTIQYAMDFSPDDVRGFRTQNRYESDAFLTYAQSLGWTVLEAGASKPPYPLAVWQCAGDDDRLELAYQGKPAKYWEAWEQFKPAERKANHMVNSYAFSDAWEWDAEYSAAYTLNELIHAATRLCTSKQAAELMRRLRKDMAHDWDYHHEYALGLPSYEQVVARQFHVDYDTWEALARRFLLGSYPGVCK